MTNKKHISYIAGGLLLIVTVVLLMTRDGRSAPLTKTIFAMDTHMEFTLYGGEADKAMDEIVRMSFEMDSRLRPNFEWEINTGGEPLNEALLYARSTGGAFDPTLAALTGLWGFASRAGPRLPAQQEIDSALNLCGYGKVETAGTAEGNALNVTYYPQGMGFDFGGVAKGYLTDAVCAALEKYKVTSAVISLGGNVYVKGVRPDGEPWRVGIRDPQGSQNDSLGLLRASDMAVITSGDYERYFIQDGVKYHHIFDASTGYPADSGLRSVTIVAARGTPADILSTALFVMGLDKGLEYWRAGDTPLLSDGFEAIFVTQDNRVVITPGLKDVFEFNGTEKGYRLEVAS